MASATAEGCAQLEDDVNMRLDESGFRGHGCAVCGLTIPVSEATQIPITITAGGRYFRYWTHRECFRACLNARLRASVENIPSVGPEEIFPSRPR